MRVLVALLAVLLSTAGCLGQDRAPVVPDTPSSPDVPGPLARFTSVVEDEPSAGTEPMLGVAPDGKLYTYSRQPPVNENLAGPMGIYQSTDDGHTWDLLHVAAAPALDPDLAVDRDGSVWYDTLSAQCNWADVLPSGTTTWVTNPAACNGPSLDRPRVVPTQGGEAYLAHARLGGIIGIVKTQDHGLTWTPLPAPRLPDSTGDAWIGGGFWNEATGSVYFTFQRTQHETPAGVLLAEESTHHPGYIVTRDGGLTWETGHFTAVAWTSENGGGVGPGLVDGTADAAGNIYLTWAEVLDGTSVVRMVSSRDDGLTWTEPVLVGPLNRTQIFPSIVAGADGRVAIAYYMADEAGRAEGLSQEAQWHVGVSWTKDAHSVAPVWQHGILTLQPNHRGSVCTEGDVTGLGCSRAFLDFFDAQALSDGRLAAVWSSTLDVPGRTVVVYGVTDAPIL